MLHRATTFVALSSALLFACLRNHRPDAMNAAKTRAQIELQCTGLESWIAHEEGLAGGRLYQVNVSGCGQTRTYPVMCQTTGGCTAQEAAGTSAPTAQPASEPAPADAGAGPPDAAAAAP